RQSSLQRFADPADYPEMGAQVVATEPEVVEVAVGTESEAAESNGATEPAAAEAANDAVVAEEEVMDALDETVAVEEAAVEAPAEAMAEEEEIAETPLAETVAAQAEVVDATANGAGTEAGGSVRVVMRRSGNFGRDQEYLDKFNRVALKHAGGAELFLLIADDEAQVALRWKLQVTPDAGFVAAIEALDGSERVEVQAAGDGGTAG
ncbi:MAG: hypothetical protein QGG58_11280, partial [Chloroflexota bacterium]|nr:hypothetical protein [Chloroflexota bacterium]